MSNVIRLSDYRDDGWVEVFTADGPNSTLQVYASAKLGQVEVVQQNDDNETIRTVISGHDVDSMALAIMKAFDKKGEAK